MHAFCAIPGCYRHTCRLVGQLDVQDFRAAEGFYPCAVHELGFGLCEAGYGGFQGGYAFFEAGHGPIIPPAPRLRKFFTRTRPCNTRIAM